ncbi:MAG: ABC transporter transmembrane domain-containing protein, partial [Roseburia sp.]
MFHKRLLKEFRDNRGYVAGMVAAQWVSLLANAGMMLVTADVIGRLLAGMLTRENIITMLIVLAVVLTVRTFAATVNSRLSFAASSQVKKRLRKLVYEKLMRLGGSYRDTIATSEAVQVSTEGVDQLEIYFAKYVPQFFYSMLAPITLFFIVGTMSLKVAVVLLVCVPLIPLSIVAVQKFAKRLLAKYWGTYTELGDTFLENLQGLTT